MQGYGIFGKTEQEWVFVDKFPDKKQCNQKLLKCKKDYYPQPIQFFRFKQISEYDFENMLSDPDNVWNGDIPRKKSDFFVDGTHQTLLIVGENGVFELRRHRRQ